MLTGTTNLFEVGSSHQFCAEIEVLTFGLFQIGRNFIKRFSQVALVSVKDDRFLFIVLSHKFQCYTGDSRLEISLFSINHHSDIHFLCALRNTETWLFILNALNILSLTLTIVLSLLIIFLNISSSFDDNCVMSLTIRPLFKSGTLKVLLSSWFSSIIPDHGNKWRILPKKRRV